MFTWISWFYLFIYFLSLLLKDFEDNSNHHFFVKMTSKVYISFPLFLCLCSWWREARWTGQTECSSQALSVQGELHFCRFHAYSGHKAWRNVLPTRAQTLRLSGFSFLFSCHFEDLELKTWKISWFGLISCMDQNIHGAFHSTSVKLTSNILCSFGSLSASQ